MGMPVIALGCITREKAVGDIIESIAMQESALAHILNAESEKIFSVVNNPSATPENLMAINHSVKQTIAVISRLEMQLQAKLELFCDTICQ